jgi:hemerythrin-like domain-containing protein
MGDAVEQSAELILGAAAVIGERGEARVVCGPQARRAVSVAIARGALGHAVVLIEDDSSRGVVVVRPRSASGEASVHEVLGDDHRRLDALLEGALALASTDPREARTLAEAFAAGLRRHIRIEEEVLFPAFEAHTGMRGAGPTEVMRREHRVIEQGLTSLLAAAHALADAAPATEAALGRAAEALLSVLGEHNRKEEYVLYPSCDRMLPPDAHAALVERTVVS